MPFKPNIDVPLVLRLLKDSFHTLQAVYLYGSVITEDFKNDSDIDIAVKTEVDISNQARWGIQEVLARKLKRNVDLLVLENSSLVMQFEVISTGERVFYTDVAKVDFYETTIYSRYLDFNFTRKSIIESIVDTGSVYGG